VAAPLVVKRGAAGALVISPDGITEVAEGVRQVRVRDLTGAGDAFAGAMIAALLRGSSLTDAVVAANAAGSEAVARLGAVGEVEVAGISTAGQTLGAKFIDRMAASQRGAAPPGLTSEERQRRVRREGGASEAPRWGANDAASRWGAGNTEMEPDL